MTTRDALLALLENHRDEYLSGEEIAAGLSVSRTAVWKAVKALEKDGYEIDAVTNRGYRMAGGVDILSEQGMKKYLRPELMTAPVSVYAEVPSTNTLLREEAAAGAPQWRVAAANRQSAGRGRQGRSFYSPGDTGLYLSVLLRPALCRAEEALGITTMAAVAMCEAIETRTDAQAGLKWVNAICMRGKKVCGILTEGILDLETGLLDAAVLGAGVNVYPPEGGFPPEIADIADAVLPRRVSDAKNRLAAEFLNRLCGYYEEASFSEEGMDSYVPFYQARSIVPGHEVTVVSGKSERSAKALSVDERCRLLVEYPDGTREALSGGEVRVRIMREKEI